MTIDYTPSHLFWNHCRHESQKTAATTVTNSKGLKSNVYIYYSMGGKGEERVLIHLLKTTPNQ